MLIKKYTHSAKVRNNKQHDDQWKKYWLPQRKIQQSPHLHHGSAHSFIMVYGAMSMMLLLLLLPLLCVDAAGYSYTRFVGPVAGPEHKIYVNNDNTANDGKTPLRGSGALHLDYVGKPEYEFAYGVEDTDAHILHNRKEKRDGDAVKGVYSVIDPDGALRVVKYTADGIHGFQAEVTRNGVSTLHGQPQYDYNRAPPSKTISNHHNIYRPDSYSQEHVNGERNVYHPSSNTRHTSTSNLEQLPQANYDLYKPYNQYQAPPQSPIIYHYNKNYDEDDGDVNNEGYSDYQEDYKPHYEVREKNNANNNNNNNNNNNGNGNGNHNHNNEDDNDNKSNNGNNKNNNHQKKKEPDSDEDDEVEDYEEENVSEELEDYDENVHQSQDSDESDEYY